MSGQNVTLLQGLYDAFARGDVPTVLAAMHPGIVWNEAEHFPYADRNPYVGPQAVLEGVFLRIAEDFEFFRVVVESLLDAGDNVVALGRYQGRHKTTGKDMDAQMAHIWWLQNGKIVRFQQYADTAQAREVSGLS
jgi:uncharacterized protein